MTDFDIDAFQFSLVCDAMERIFFAGKDGIENYFDLLVAVGGEDVLLHTSPDARRAAVAVFAALGLE